MIFGYKTNEHGIQTVIVAAIDNDEYQKFIGSFVGIDETSGGDKVEILSMIEMMMEEDFSHLKFPVIRVTHTTDDHRDTFFVSNDVKEISIPQAISRQDDMQRAQDKKEEQSVEKLERLKAEISGDVYISPSIEEKYGLNIHDPWDTRTAEERNAKISQRNDDPTILQETMFGGADEQRAARDAARLAADPDYVPIRFAGHGELEEEDLSLDKLIFKAKSKETEKLSGVVESAEEEMNNDSEESLPTPISEGPVYLDSTTNKSRLEELEELHEENLEDKNTNGKIRSLDLDEEDDAVFVMVNSLPESIKAKITEVFSSKAEAAPESIKEYWYSANSMVGDFYILPEDRTTINGAYKIVSMTNVDASAYKKINIAGPTARLIKKQNSEEDSVILYSRSFVDNDGTKERTTTQFMAIRLK